MARAALYRHFDATGRLLYVGMTAHLSQRTGAHLAAADWRDLIANVTIEIHESRASAAQAERVAIATENPAHNKTLRVKAVAPRKVGSFREALLARMAKDKIGIAALARGTGVSHEALKKLCAREGASTSVETAILIAGFFGASVNDFVADAAIAEAA